MENSIPVQMSHSQSYAMGDVHLQVVGHISGGALQKVCETLFHQLHQKNGFAGVRVLHHSQELDNVGMSQVSQDLALLLKSSNEVTQSWILGGGGGVLIS